MEREQRRTVRLDPETERLLTFIARRFEGNVSMALRWAIRQAASQANAPAPGNAQRGKG